MKRILVTGHRGFIGRHLVRKLGTRGYNAVLLKGDITKPKSITGCAKGVDVVVHLAARLMDNPFDNSHYKVNVKGTENMLNETKKSNARFIFVSTAGVYGPCMDANEESTVNPENIYEKTKLMAEKLVIGSGLDYIILRPGLIFGPGEKRLMKLFTTAKKGVLPLIDSGKTKIQPLFIDDFTDIILKIIEKNIRNQLFVVAGEKQITIKKFVKTMNQKALLIPVPVFLVMPFAVLFDVLSKIMKKDLLLNMSRMNFFTKTRTFDIAKIKELSTAFTPLKKAIEITKNSL